MTKILICASDDPEHHLRTLQERNAEWEVRASSDWTRFHETLKEERPDLVVLEAHAVPRGLKDDIEKILDQRPDLPVVVIGRDWWNRSPVRALDIGAASFVPKSAQARNLAATVERVLALAGRARKQVGLQTHVVSTSCLLRLENDPSLIPAVISDVQDRIDEFPGWTERELLRIGVAIEESALNAMIHGNLEVSSALKEVDHALFQKRVETRRLEAGYGTRRVELELRVTQRQAEITVRDEGPGFDSHALADPTDPQNISKPSGRGVLLMRAFMDSVKYNERGNEVLLIKANGGATA